MDTANKPSAGGPRRPGLDYLVWPGWRVLMHDAGLATAPVLRRARLPGDLFAGQNVCLDPDSFFKLWNAIDVEAASLDADLPAPLRMARVMSSDWFAPELFVALCSANLAGALERIAKYVRLIAPMAIKVERAPVHTTVSIGFLGDGGAPPGVFLAFMLVFFVQLGRLGARSHIQPLRVGLPSAPAAGPTASLYAAFFGVPVTASPAATLVFATADVERPFLTANHKMWLFFEPPLRQRLADFERTAAMAERVRGALRETLPAGEASMLAVSRRLGVSTRTLQRRLRDEGTTFQQTLDTLRDALAHNYLRNTALSGAEISFLLGFEDANSFARAFQVWTGRTPQAVRLDRAFSISPSNVESI